MPFAADPDRTRESRKARVPLADLPRLALEIRGDFGIAPKVDGQWNTARQVPGDGLGKPVDQVGVDCLAGHDA
jgi:hypothetical protein